MNLKLAVTIPILIFCGIIIEGLMRNPQIKKISTNAESIVKTEKEKIFKPVAVLELFTSQGCSSCPPADALLAKTIKDAQENNKNIYALSFHVDYWNRLGWTDPFSDESYSKRQNNYVQVLGLNGAYTPQLIVNGKYEFVGSDKGALTKAVSNALQTNAEATFIYIKAVTTPAGIKVTYQTGGDYKNCLLNFALISASETTQIKRGENGGRTLVNENVVRAFKTIPASAIGEILFALRSSNNQKLSVIAYFQHKGDLAITGAGEVPVKSL